MHAVCEMAHAKTNVIYVISRTAYNPKGWIRSHCIIFGYQFQGKHMLEITGKGSLQLKQKQPNATKDQCIFCSGFFFFFFFLSFFSFFFFFVFCFVSFCFVFLFVCFHFFLECKLNFEIFEKKKLTFQRRINWQQRLNMNYITIKIIWIYEVPETRKADKTIYCLWQIMEIGESYFHGQTHYLFKIVKAQLIRVHHLDVYHQGRWGITYKYQYHSYKMIKIDQGQNSHRDDPIKIWWFNNIDTISFKLWFKYRIMARLWLEINEHW